MNLLDVAKEIAGRAARVPGLKTFHYPASAITPPAFEVLLPDEHEFDQTFQGGMTEFALVGNLYVGKNDDQGAYETLYGYLGDDGPLSIKAAVDDAPGDEYASCDTVTAERVGYGVFPVGLISFLGAQFTIRVTGPGRARE